MIRALIFDCFGVLTSDGWLAYRDSKFTPGSDDYEQARYLNRQVDAGHISYDDFLAAVADLAGVSKHDVQHAIENNKSNTRLFEYIRDTLKPEYKIGLLSNAGANWLNDLFEPWQVALFDEVALSYETGVSKPDSRAYDTIATKLGVLPDECIFIDDQSAFAEGARDAGMQGVIFRDTASCIAELGKMLHK